MSISRAGRWLRLCLLLPWLVWALIPTGYMPVASQPGQITVAICTGAGVVEMRLGPDGAPVEDTHGSSDPCAFAGFVGLALLPEPGASAAPAMAADTAPWPRQAQVLAQRARPAFEPRGPPQPI